MRPLYKVLNFSLFQRGTLQSTDTVAFQASI